MPRRHLGREVAYPVTVGHQRPPVELTALALRQALLPPLPAVWGRLNSYDCDPQQLWSLPVSMLGEQVEAFEGTPGQTRLLRVGAVSRVVSLHRLGAPGLTLLGEYPSPFPEPVRVYGVEGAQPRSYVVSGARVADGGAALATLLDPTFDPAREVLLARGAPSPPGPSPGEVRLVEWAPDRLRLQATLSAPGWVVLVDTFDPGWRAQVDGQRAEVLRANIAFRAVRVEPGQHEITYRYRPRSVGLGLSISAGAALLVGVALARHRAGTAGRAARG